METENTFSEQELFILSEHALTNIVDQIKPEQWNLKVPASIQKDGPTLREVINYHAYDDAWVPDVLEGKTIKEVGTKYDGDLLGDNPKESFHKIVDKAVEAVRSLKDPKKIVHLSYGDYEASTYLWHITTFRLYRTVDLARFLNLDDSLPMELVEGMWKILEPQANYLRELGLFGPPVSVGEDADLFSKLMAISGRPPNAKTGGTSPQAFSKA